MVEKQVSQRRSTGSPAKTCSTPLFIILFTLSFTPQAQSTHYRGGTITWRPSPRYNESFKQIDFSFRLSWKFSHSPCGRAGDLLLNGPMQRWSCASGCNGSVGITKTYCEAFSEKLGFSTGRNNFSHVFFDNGPIEISYGHCCWVNGVNTQNTTQWRLTTRVLLGTRNDTGQVNSAPTVLSSLTQRLQLGRASVIKLNVEDDDGDDIQCRLGQQERDCGGACKLPRGFHLDQDNCEIKFDGASDVIGLHAVALLVEDFQPKDEEIMIGGVSIPSGQAISSVPFQFTIDVQECVDMKPTLRLSSDENKVDVGKTFTMSVIGKTCENRQRIEDFSVTGPLGLIRSDTSINQQGNSEMTLSWQPTREQLGSNKLCVRATQSDGLESEEECQRIMVQSDFFNCRSLYGTQYQTFDGYHYNFTGNCRYQLAATLFQQKQPLSFDISILNEFDDAERRHLIRAVYVSISGINITLNSNKEVFIHGFPLRLPFSKQNLEVNRLGKYITVKSGDDVMIRYDGNAAITLSLAARYMKKVEGLCGNFNGNQSDEMQVFGKIGEVQDLMDFVQLYQVESESNCTMSQSLADNIDCGGQQMENILATCSILTEENGCFQECHALINPMPFFDSCINAFCGQGSLFTTADFQLGYYADACQLENVTICNWRERTGIVMDCPTNSQYSVCTTQTAQTCKNMEENLLNTTLCAEGCECDKGFFLSADGSCAPMTSCGCFLKDTYRAPGFMFRTDDCSHECTCKGANMSACAIATPCETGEVCQKQRDGFFTCAPRRSPRATCKVIGDPHYQTFDGVVYDSMSTCAHILIRSRQNSSLVPFTVIGINEEPRFSYYRVSQIREVQVQVGVRTNISLSKGPAITLNGIAVNPGSVFNGVRTRRTSTFLVVTFDFGLVIRWDGVDRLRITAESSLRDKVEGLCGNYDGISDNDFARPDGTPADVAGFVNSWRVNGTDMSGNLFPSPPHNATAICANEGFSGEEFNVCVEIQKENTTASICRDREEFEENPCDNQLPEDLDQYRVDCSILVDPLGPFAPCHDIFDPFTSFTNCIFDLCAYNGNSTAREVILSSYDFDCREENINNSLFRNDSNSGVFCDEKSSEYSDCVSQCEPSCDDPDGSRCREQMIFGDFCDEGCRCLDGFIRSAAGLECVSREKCGCLIKGIYQEQGYTYRTSDCREECTCSGDGVVACRNVPSCEIGFACLSTVLGFEECVGSLRMQSTCTVTEGRYFTTFDNDMYEWLATCSYVMVQSSLNVGPDFIIVANFEKTSNKHFSTISSIRVIVDEKPALVIDQSSSIDGSSLFHLSSNHTAIADRLGGSIVVTFSVGITLIWDFNSSLRIIAADELRGQVQGLCGDFNDHRNTTVKSDITSYVDSWSYGDNKNRCQNETLPISTLSCNLSIAQEQCVILLQTDGPFVTCISAVDPFAYFDRCLTASCASNHSRDAQDEVFNSYAMKCRDGNISVEAWRATSNRTLSCPPNSIYTPCLATCQPSCLDMRGERCTQMQNELCIEGCQCEAGFFYDNGSCVLAEECGCKTPDDVSIRTNETRINYACTESCSCVRGVVRCSNISCLKDQYCGLRHSQYGCHWIGVTSYRSQQLVTTTCANAYSENLYRWRAYDNSCKLGRPSLLRQKAEAYFTRLDECEYNNGGCSHTCDVMEGGVVCSCPPKYQLDADRRTCISTSKGASPAICINGSSEAEQFTRWRKRAVNVWTARLQRYLESFEAAANNEGLSSVCGSRWTQWLNRDGPGGDGDEETLPLLQSEFPQLLCKNPVAVEARLSDGRPATLSGNNVTISPTVGLLCLNNQQPPGRRCANFQVRFLCLDTLM